MKLSFDSVSRHKGLVGVALICGLTAVGCSKQTDENNAEEAPVEVAASNAPAVQCDDQVALTQLTQSVQTAVNAQTQGLFNSYAERANANLSFSGADEAVGSILIDVANPTMLQEANADGMVTCQASLSLTLPNKDVTRASKVYETLEGGNLADYLQSQNITLNNNMLVSNNFNYVVGMQGGQATARLVGQPAILASAADIIARSQFQRALDASRAGPATSKPRYAPAMPSEPRVRTEPKPRPEPEQKQRTPVQRETTPARVNELKVETEVAKPKVETNVESKPKQPKEPKENLTVPTDENIEMVIVEEEGTY